MAINAREKQKKRKKGEKEIYPVIGVEGMNSEHQRIFDSNYLGAERKRD